MEPPADAALLGMPSVRRPDAPAVSQRHRQTDEIVNLSVGDVLLLLVPALRETPHTAAGDYELSLDGV
jgi:hypothetical protein